MIHLKTPNVPIGIAPNMTFRAASCQLSRGSDLYVFSDGCYEVPSPEGKLLGLEALGSILEKITHKTCAGYPIRLESLVQLLQRFSGEALLDDDSSLLRVRFDLN